MWIALAAIQATMTPPPTTVETDIACAAAIAIELKQVPVAYRPGVSMMLAYLLGRLERAAPDRDLVAEIDHARTLQRKRPLASVAREQCFEDAGRVTDILIAMVPPGT